MPRSQSTDSCIVRREAFLSPNVVNWHTCAWALSSTTFGHASRTLFSDGWTYISVLRGVECPNRLCSTKMSTPLSFKWLANECLNVCGVTLKCVFIFDADKIFLKLSSMVRIAMGFPFLEINTLFSLSLFKKYFLTESHSVIISFISSVMRKTRRFFPLPITVSFLSFKSISFKVRSYTSPARSRCKPECRKAGLWRK